MSPVIIETIFMIFSDFTFSVPRYKLIRTSCRCLGDLPGGMDDSIHRYRRERHGVTVVIDLARLTVRSQSDDGGWYSSEMDVVCRQCGVCVCE